MEEDVLIDFLLNGRIIASGRVKSGSCQADREAVAIKLGVDYFNGFILDKGRVEARKGQRLNGFVDNKGYLWHIVDPKIGYIDRVKPKLDSDGKKKTE